jgi:dTDP-4-amino-4,6-dideoxygalactose transaminase
LIDFLNSKGIPTVVYYPKPLHCQPAYCDYPHVGEKTLIQSEKLAKQVLSLPVHPYLDESDQDKIIEAIRDYSNK